MKKLKVYTCIKCPKKGKLIKVDNCTHEDCFYRGMSVNKNINGGRINCNYDEKK